MNHTTKWNRMNLNESIMQRLKVARAIFLNGYDALPDPKTAKGICRTAYPDGTIKIK